MVTPHKQLSGRVTAKNPLNKLVINSFRKLQLPRLLHNSRKPPLRARLAVPMKSSRRCGSLPPSMQTSYRSIAAARVVTAGDSVTSTSGAIWWSSKRNDSKRLSGKVASPLMLVAMAMTIIVSLTLPAHAVTAMVSASLTSLIRVNSRQSRDSLTPA